MKMFFEKRGVTVICRTVTVILLFIGALKAAFFGVSVIWPICDYDLRLPSPDGRYELVVLRGDAAAFDDFSYHIYVFPHKGAPKERPRGQRVLKTGVWREEKYLVYSGYSYPEFRWTAPHSVEIDLNDGEDDADVNEFHPVKRLGDSKPIVASLIFGREDPRNISP